jgi:tRNA (cytidine/uridine-2'-O-)-methyltransferase
LLPRHALKIVLVEPEIPQNAGNVARLCAVTGAELHLVRPLGFFVGDKHFKRAGMDYLKHVTMHVHDDVAALLTRVGDERVWITSGFGKRPHWDATFAAGDWILFGKESAGLPAALREKFAERELVIPMKEGERGINLATSAGIVLYEALRQISLG